MPNALTALQAIDSRVMPQVRDLHHYSILTFLDVFDTSNDLAHASRNHARSMQVQILVQKLVDMRALNPFPSPGFCDVRRSGARLRPSLRGAARRQRRWLRRSRRA